MMEQYSNDWIEYKKHIIASIEELKVRVDKIEQMIAEIRTTVAILNTKLMVASAATSIIVAAIVSTIVGKIGG
jgi:translation elongation factor EF-4